MINMLMAGPRWLWILATAVPTLWALIDMGVHFHDGYLEGEEQLRVAMVERELCVSMDRPSRLLIGTLREACEYIRSKPVPVPWKRGVHVAWSGMWDTMEGMVLRLIQIALWPVVTLAIAVLMAIYLFRTSVFAHDNPWWWWWWWWWSPTSASKRSEHHQHRSPGPQYRDWTQLPVPNEKIPAQRRQFYP